MTDLTNHILGSYRILTEIGGGGMATVYRAYDGHAGRLVALKLLLPHLWHDREFVERFQREGRNAAALQHDNIVSVYESGVVEGYPYLAMAYVEGGTLAERLLWQRGPLPLPRAAEILGQIAAALDYAHARGLVHRDVKPSNVLLARDGQALLTDFGIAKAAWDSKLTQTGTRIGTPTYMAPEQARGQPVDRRTDVYALGVMLYEMVTGRPPFQGNTDAVLYQHVHEPPPPPRSLNPALPPAAERIILRALAKDPARRYSTTGELAAAFQRAVEPATRIAPPTSIIPQTPGAGRARPVTPARRPLSPGQILALAGIAGIALIVLVLALSSRTHWLQPVSLPTVTPLPGTTPTLAATPSPVRTVTLTPPPSPTLTPTPLPTPLPTPTPLPAPKLTGPEDGTVYYAWQEVTLTWSWSTVLMAHQRFVVVVEDVNGSQVLTGTVGPGQETVYTFRPADAGLWVGECRWTVWVEREVEGEWEVVAQARAWRTFRVLSPPTPTPEPTTMPTEPPPPPPPPPTDRPPAERPTPPPTRP